MRFGRRRTSDPVRHSLRDKLTRAVDEVVGRHRQEQEQNLERDLERLAKELRTQLAEDIEREVTRAVDRIIEFEVRSRKDIIYAGDTEAARQSNEFAREHLLGTEQFGHPSETLDYALSLAPTGGMALEFGVATGATLSTIAARRRDGKVYGFDSFQGLPEHWLPGMPAGVFARDDLPEIPGAELVVGMFDDTLPAFLDSHSGPVDLLHVDSDLYSSAKTVLEHVVPRMRPGGVIVFDEFFNYPGWQRHEYRAWREYVEHTGLEFSYLAYTYTDAQVVVRLR